MCQHCGWEKASVRAEDIAEALPEFKTRKIDFYESVAETIFKLKHVTDRQLEVIEEGERDVEALEDEASL